MSKCISHSKWIVIKTEPRNTIYLVIHFQRAPRAKALQINENGTIPLTQWCWVYSLSKVFIFAQTTTDTMNYAWTNKFSTTWAHRAWSRFDLMNRLQSSKRWLHYQSSKICCDNSTFKSRILWKSCCFEFSSDFSIGRCWCSRNLFTHAIQAKIIVCVGRLSHAEHMLCYSNIVLVDPSQCIPANEFKLCYWVPEKYISGQCGNWFF